MIVLKLTRAEQVLLLQVLDKETKSSPVAVKLYEKVFEAINPEGPLMMAAQRVVAARHYQGDDGWDKLKLAIAELEDLIS